MTERPTEFSALYRKYGADLFRFAFYLSGDRDDAEDIASETFARLWTADAPIVAETVKAYLFTIARNLFLQRRRKQSRHVGLDDRLADSAAGAHHAVEQREALGAVTTKLANLPDTDRVAVLMRADGDSYEAIAEALGVSVVAARVRVHRARAALSAIR